MYQDYMKKVQQQRWERQQVLERGTTLYYLNNLSLIRTIIMNQ